MKVININSKRHGLFNVIIDDEDFDLVNSFNWGMSNVKSKKGYAANNEVGLMHRFILGLTDPKIYVDHKNQNTLDNRRENIRICTSSQNQANRSAIKGKYLGVCWYKRTKKWVASLRKNGKTYHIGYYNDEIDAAKAYNRAAIKFHGEFACLNKISEKV